MRARTALSSLETANPEDALSAGPGVGTLGFRREVAPQPQRASHSVVELCRISYPVGW